MTVDQRAIRFPFLLSGSHRRTVPAEVAGIKIIKYTSQNLGKKLDLILIV